MNTITSENQKQGVSNGFLNIQFWNASIKFSILDFKIVEFTGNSGCICPDDYCKKLMKYTKRHTGAFMDGLRPPHNFRQIKPFAVQVCSRNDLT